MREILFRGKRIANDEWVSGYYVVRKRPYFKGKGADFEHIICDNLVIDDSNDKQFVDTIPITYSVDPETVGQYTGLTDVNGNKNALAIFICAKLSEIFLTPLNF
ncbi:MAG: hypothetical protein KH080_05450 [Ruminococcus sp.]|nr:hypothetical protein [Ruminococcus sp.]